MNNMRSEIQAFDKDYKALMFGGAICLTGAAVTVFLHVCATYVKTSTDGSGIALLLLLVTGCFLMSRGIGGRNRVRDRDWYLQRGERRFHGHK
jgi:4-hydroxybenzoate polyprenyltransferase